jgi:two-component system CitB family sensor kinase
MWRSRTLASQILLGVTGILLVTVSLGGYLYVTLNGRSLDEQYQQRAVGIANAVSEIPDIRAALARHDPDHVIGPLAARIRASTGAAYIVVTDRDGIRYSHPNPALVGRKLEEPVAALDGRDHVGIDEGSLGHSANGKAPVFADGSGTAAGGPAAGGTVVGGTAVGGTVIGQVSVGILETTVAGQQRHQVVIIAVYSLLALGFGMVASWLLASRIKQVTFGLELAEITSLLQEREAMLHGIREGVIGFDRKGRVNVINAEAQRLLQVGPGVLGRPLAEVVAAGRLRDLLSGAIDGADQVALTEGSLLVVNRMPVVLAGRDAGSVVTLRDRTEMEALIRELRGVSSLIDTLRAQEHEYANRLHVLLGLLEMGEPAEAVRYLSDIVHGSFARAEQLRARIEPPALAALLIAKITVAAENDVDLVVAEDSHLDRPGADPQQLLTILGNLVDNAIEALAGQPAPRRITVRITDADGIRIVVADNGPGVSTAELARVFTDGYSTKVSNRGMRRGLGLALVQRIVRRAGGTVEVTPGPGARFEVWLPPAPHRAGDAGHAGHAETLGSLR